MLGEGQRAWSTGHGGARPEEAGEGTEQGQARSPRTCKDL